MNTKLSIIGASVALLFSVNASAQESSGTSNSSAQQSQKQQTEQQHKAAMDKCKGMQGNAKEICTAEADGQKKVGEAQAKMTGHDSPKSRLELAETKADAEYNVAKAKCGDQVGDVKKACENEAKATQDLAKAKAKRESLTQSAGAGSASGISGATSSSGSSGTSSVNSASGASGSGSSSGTSGASGSTGASASSPSEASSGSQMTSPGAPQPATPSQ